MKEGPERAKAGAQGTKGLLEQARHTWTLLLRILKVKNRNSFLKDSSFEVLIKMQMTKNIHSPQCSWSMEKESLKSGYMYNRVTWPYT